MYWTQMFNPAYAVVVNSVCAPRGLAGVQVWC